MRNPKVRYGRPPKFSDWDRLAVQRASDEGKSTRQIAALLNMSASSVRRMLAEKSAVPSK